MDSKTPNQSLEDILARYRQPLTRGNLHFAPIRHHSPACAWHVQALIKQLRPTHLMVELPPETEPLIHHLNDPELKPPVALYLSTHRKSAEDTGASLPERRSGLYPMLEFSPELVAIRAALTAGIKITTIDLPFSDRGWAETVQDGSNIALANDAALQRGRLVTEMMRRFHARDADELWEALFETPAGALRPEQYFGQVAAWCHAIRASGVVEPLDQRRETHMRGLIDAAETRATGPVLVLIGGYHLPPLLADAPPAMAEAQPETHPAQSDAWLIRTSWKRMDKAYGYGAGMPAPYWHQGIWKAAMTSGHFGGSSQMDQLVMDQLLTLATTSRKQHGLHSTKAALPLIPTDAVIAAQTHALGLAALRNREAPARAELYDAVLSCMVKGDALSEASPLLESLTEALTGAGMGQVPQSVDVPPLVEQARTAIAALDLPLEEARSAEVTLEIYRNQRDRQRSRLLYALGYLGVRYGQPLAGPDFARAERLGLLRERWSCRWSTTCEMALVDASQDGQSIEEACLRRLLRELDQLQLAGRGDNVDALGAILLRACQMGLHSQAPRLINRLSSSILVDPVFAHHAQALISCQLLWQAREPLGGAALHDLPAIQLALYQRACALLSDAARQGPDQEDANLSALAILREAVTASTTAGSHQLDPALLILSLDSILNTPDLNPLIQGAAVGTLYGMGQISAARLGQIVAARMAARASEAAAQSRFLRGLISSAREALWQVPDLLQRMDKVIAGWDRDLFLSCLPELRLAFTGLSPRETADVAKQVARLHGAKSMGDLDNSDITLAEAAHGQLIGPELERLLAADHLTSWLMPDEEARS
ncbi:MAG: DUF5682 family protein [Alphaproteobacteria bacterium]